MVWPYVELIASPTKYYDNYQIKEIKYYEDGKENSKKYILFDTRSLFIKK